MLLTLVSTPSDGLVDLLSAKLWINSNFARLWAAQAGSAVGASVSRSAIPMLAILLVGANAGEVAVLSAMSIGPGLLVSLFAGGWLDRAAKRRVLIICDLVRAAALLLLPLAAWLGLIDMFYLYLVAGVVGIATTLFQIADNSYLPQVVTKSQLVAANSRLETTDAVAEAAGPSIAGFLVQAIGAPLTILVDAVSYLWSAFMLSRIGIVEPIAEVKTDAPETGFGFLSALPLLRVTGMLPLLRAETIITFSGGAFFALYFIVALDYLALSPLVVGMIVSMGGISAIAGAALCSPLIKVFGERPLMISAGILGAAANLFIPLALFIPDYAIACLVAAQLLGDGLLTMFMIIALSMRQRALPDDSQARGHAIFHFGNGAALFGGTLLTGALTPFIATPHLLLAAAIIGVAGSLTLFSTPHPPEP